MNPNRRIRGQVTFRLDYTARQIRRVGHNRDSSEYDTERYKERHLVECFFSKLKHFRRCFSRFDKLACHYLSFLYFASTLIWLR